MAPLLPSSIHLIFLTSWRRLSFLLPSTLSSYTYLTPTPSLQAWLPFFQAAPALLLTFTFLPGPSSFLHYVSILLSFTYLTVQAHLFSFLTAPVVSPPFHFPSRPFLPSSARLSSFLSRSLQARHPFFLAAPPPLPPPYFHLPSRPVFLTSWQQHLSFLFPFIFVTVTSSLSVAAPVLLPPFLSPSQQAHLPAVPCHGPPSFLPASNCPSFFHSSSIRP